MTNVHISTVFVEKVTTTAAWNVPRAIVTIGSHDFAALVLIDDSSPMIVGYDRAFPNIVLGCRTEDATLQRGFEGRGGPSGRVERSTPWCWNGDEVWRGST